jgi:lysophospholipid acyltransferase (LPLAT)-like uncharacterized protein
VPYPFSNAVFLYGDPIRIARDADVQEERKRIERELNALADTAERMISSQ